MWSRLFLIFLGLGLTVNVVAAQTPTFPFDRITTYYFRYEVNLEPFEDEGKSLSIWVPYPSESEHQKVISFSAQTPVKGQLKTEPKYGNRMLYFEMLTSKKPVKMSFHYRIVRHPYEGIKDVDLSGVVDPKKYLGPNKLVPVFPQIEEIAKKVTEGVVAKTEGGAIKDSEKVQAFYDYIYNTMKYDKSGEGWGKGDAIWACDAKRGNCTDFHSLWIALNRTQKIPARFQIGVPLTDHRKKGEVAGYHCWAEAYIEGEGWKPVDASEAKKAGLKEAFYGHLPSDRIHFSTGRDLVLSPAQKGEPLNYFIYPYVELEGDPYQAVQKKFYYSMVGTKKIKKVEEEKPAEEIKEEVTPEATHGEGLK